MRRSVMRVHNREALRSDRELYPHIEACVATVVDRQLLKRVLRSDVADWGRSDWLVFQDENGRGFGLCGDEVSSSKTIQSKLKQATALWRIGTALRGRAEPRLTLREGYAPPSDWAIFKVLLQNDEMWCAISTPSPFIPGVVPNAGFVGSVRARVFGAMAITDVPIVGALLSFDSLVVRIVDFDVDGVLRIEKGGNMTIDITDRGREDDMNVPGVRLDLGELEISLQDLLALQSGEVIALGPVDPMTCYLRVGSSLIARGELRQSEEGVSVLITHVSS